MYPAFAKRATEQNIHRIPKRVPMALRMGWIFRDSGSDISGHRNPETDSAYKEMRRQLEAFGRQKKFLLLESLV
jgi:hypothetical protein